MYACEAELFAAIEKMEARWDAREKETREKEQKAAAELNPDAKPKPPSERELYDMEIEKICKNFQKLLPKLMPDHCDCSPEFQEILKKDGYMCCAAAAKAAGLDVGVPDPPKPDSESPKVSPPHGLDDLFHESMYKYHLPEPPRKRKSNESITEEEATTIKSTGAVPKTTINRSELPVKRINKQDGCSSEPLKKKVKKEHSEGKIVLEIDLDCEFSMENIQKFRSNTVREDPFPSGICLTNQIMLTKQFHIPKPLPMVANALDIKKIEPMTTLKIDDNVDPQDEQLPDYSQCKTPPCTPAKLQPEEGEPQDEESPGYPECETRPCTPFELQPEEGDPQDEESPGYSQWEIRPCTPFELQPEEGDPQDEESPGYSQWEIRPCTPFELQPEEGDPQDEESPGYPECKTRPCTPFELQPEEGDPQDEESPGYSQWEIRPCTPFELQPEEGDPQDEESPGYSQWEIRPGTPFELQPEEGDPQDEESPGYSQWEIRPCTPFELQPEEGDPQDEESPGYSQWETRPGTPFELQPVEGQGEETLPMAVAYALGLKKSGSMPTLKIDDDHDPQVEAPPCTPAKLQPEEGQGEGGWLSPPVVVDDGRLDLLSSSIPEHNAIIEKMLDKNPVGRFYWD
ncbi:uncharacterized protein LOC133848685 [Drosophila sulfurigaster albostrigata]|uniref:uncharacterized protein LOC133848685 n=1 Tax=Drosophila sulfurigaster albostrigata TaxID=89887 RepID=UPI002D21EB8B|nr:uncharacterized protein LOC133848685 [Drosophila sulfurigaster albostrigata]